MLKVLTVSELRKMQEADLLREITQQYRTIAKLKHAVKGGTEKGSHLLKQAKTQLARMLTALSELHAKQAASTIPTSVPSATGARTTVDKPTPLTK